MIRVQVRDEHRPERLDSETQASLCLVHPTQDARSGIEDVERSADDDSDARTGAIGGEERSAIAEHDDSGSNRGSGLARLSACAECACQCERCGDETYALRHDDLLGQTPV